MILAVDPGDARIGLALSDETQTIARPLTVIRHVARAKDAQKIVQFAEKEGAVEIVVGVAFDQDGNVGHQARKCLRLVAALEEISSIPILTWDESGSSQAVRRGAGKDPQLDARAAAVILQDYINVSKK